MTTDTGVVVIGGGAVGLCVARALREKGREVTVLERDDFGAGCSVGNAGLVVPSHIVPMAAPGVVAQGLRWLLRRESPFRIKPRLDRSLLRWLWRFYWACTDEHVRESVPVLRDLSLASRTLYAEWAETGNGRGFGFRPSGLLMLHKTKTGRSKDVKEADRAREAGLEIRVHDRDGLADLTSHLPPDVNGGVYYPQDALLQPARLIEALQQELERRGVALRSGVQATGFERDDGTLRAVQTTEGTIEAEAVVLAAGAWSKSLARQLDLDLPVEPAKGYSVTVESPNGSPDVPFILAEDKVSVTPMGEELRVAGTLELAGFDGSVDPHRVRPILETAAEYGAAIDPTAPETADVWVGFRPCTPDGLPLIGPVPQYDNLVLATGHCMLGVSLAPITGQLVAEVLTGESPAQDLGPLRLGRFNGAG